MKNFLFINLGLLFNILFFIGCGTVPKLHQTSSNYNEIIKEKNDVLVIIDTCLYIDEVGDASDNFNVHNSVFINDLISTEIKSKFSDNTLNIKEIITPTMCGFYPKDILNIKLKVDKDSPIVYSHLPYNLDKNIDIEYKEKLLRLMKSLYINVSNPRLVEFSLDSNLKDDLEYIKDKAKVNKILIITNQGNYISTGKRISQGLGTFVMTLGVATAWNNSLFNSYVSLIDIDKEEIIWKSAVAFRNNSFLEDNFIKEHYKKTILDEIVQKDKK